MEMSRADAANLARQSRTMLLERLHHGGQDMPAFPHLREAEINSLVAYLRQLAGVPGAERDQLGNPGNASASGRAYREIDLPRLPRRCRTKSHDAATLRRSDSTAQYANAPCKREGICEEGDPRRSSDDGSAAGIVSWENAGLLLLE